jgi:hypothetical protein
LYTSRKEIKINNDRHDKRKRQIIKGNDEENRATRAKVEESSVRFSSFVSRGKPIFSFNVRTHSEEIPTNLFLKIPTMSYDCHAGAKKKEISQLFAFERRGQRGDKKTIIIIVLIIISRHWSKQTFLGRLTCRKCENKNRFL